MLGYPLVSCIMPCRGRPEMAALAVRSYESQDYTPREIIVIDDVDDPAFPGGSSPAISCYERIAGGLTVGAKRNLAISRSSGDIICHWDSDDWSAPNRITDQVERLRTSGHPVTGYRTMLFVDEAGRWWLYTGGPGFALGTSLCYTREFWRLHPFQDRQVGEDYAHVVAAQGRIAVIDGGLMMVARIHAGNTSRKPDLTAPLQWQAIPSPFEFSNG